MNLWFGVFVTRQTNFDQRNTKQRRDETHVNRNRQPKQVIPDATIVAGQQMQAVSAAREVKPITLTTKLLPDMYLWSDVFVTRRPYFLTSVVFAQHVRFWARTFRPTLDW